MGSKSTPTAWLSSPALKARTGLLQAFALPSRRGQVEMPNGR